jgi:hypothetical protein
VGIFRRKNEYSILQESSVLELEAIHLELNATIEVTEAAPSSENFKQVFDLAKKFVFHYKNNCPPNFMLRLNHESLSDYKRFQNWLLDAGSAREWALGGYLLLEIGGGKSISKEEAQKIFDRLSEGMTPLSGHLPSLSNALFKHGQSV